MTVANVSQGNAGGLPQALRIVQAAIHLPEVQEMLCKLSAYNLGIYIPQRHDDEAGDFLLLPDSVMQVGAGLEISFQTNGENCKPDGTLRPCGVALALWCICGRGSV